MSYKHIIYRNLTIVRRGWWPFWTYRIPQLWATYSTLKEAKQAIDYEAFNSASGIEHVVEIGDSIASIAHQKTGLALSEAQAREYLKMVVYARPRSEASKVVGVIMPGERIKIPTRKEFLKLWSTKS